MQTNALVSQLCRVECVQALAGEKRAKMLGESDRARKLHDACSTALDLERKGLGIAAGIQS
jgi:hypothetical protein